MECNNSYIINKNNLIHNVNFIKNRIGKSVKFCAVLKCDSYELGVENVVPIIDDEVDFYAVANFIEATNLRKLTEKPVLILGVVELENIPHCVDNNFSITVNSLEYLNDISNTFDEGKIKVHIKINTGMNRYGVSDSEKFDNMIKVIKTKQNIILEGIYTHFATSDKNIDVLKKQHEIFEKFILKIENEKILIHCCSSFASIKCGKFLHDMVRIGFALYSKCDYCKKLRSVLSIKSKVVHINYLLKGDSVGYGCSYVADKNMKIGVVPFGYGDGLSRCLSNTGFFLVKGQIAKILGNVCMDAVMIDLTDIEDVKIGDDVTILGCDGKRKLSLDTYANLLDTSPYEILTNFKRNRLNTIVL